MSSSAPRQTWQPPSLAELQALLPGYEFLALVGRGGMGAVFKATQRSLNRPVAIKVLPAKLMEDADANFAARFRQEALTMAKLTHPGIVGVFESGEAGGLLYIVMEFVDGTDVARMIAGEGRLAPELVTKLFTQVCDALHYAHERGVIHRDIKPANLLLTRDGTVKIADFGLAKHDDAALQGLTRTNVAIGTPDFLAPEAWTPNTPLDRRSDVYALGVTLYQMLTGEVPRGLWKMPSVKAGVDARFDAIIDRAMQPDPKARYQSSAALRGDLEKIQTKPRSAEHRSALGEQSASEPSDARRSAPPALRRVAGVLLVLALILAGVIVAVWPRRPPSQPGIPTQTEPDSVAGVAEPATPPPLLVTNLADAGPGSLRQLIAESTNGATIAFARRLSGQTILLTSGHLHLDKNLTIDASGLSRGIRLDGGRASRIFFVASNTTVALDSLTITNGVATALDDANIGGGGVYNAGRLTVSRCTLAGNSTKGGGGGIGSRGPLTVHQCTLTGNRAFGGGGIGIYYFSGGTLAVHQSTLSGNKAEGTGKVGKGDDVFAYVASVASFNSIISDLHLDQAGLRQTGTNLIQTYAVGEDRPENPAPVTEAPRLAPLGDYGGPTPTMPPLPGSPAIDAGSDAGITSRHKDQRGFVRRVGARVDIGAVEVARPALQSVVVNTNDSGPGSLRQAMKESASGALITFATNLSGQTIRLTSGHLPLDNNLTIDASALPDGIILDGNKRSRIFNVPEGNFTNVLTSLIITNGTEEHDGAGIYNRGDLTLNRCQFRRNRGKVGAALYALQGRTVLNDCVFADNKADYGGAIMNWGTLVANRSTFSGNHANYIGGGAIHNGGDGKEFGVLELNQCTLAGNACTDTKAGRGLGGGLFNQGRAALNHTTISGNTALSGGGVHNSEIGILVLSNSIVAGNRAGAEDSADIFGAFTGAHNLTTGDPRLAPLGDHGGLTATMPPLPGSPAIDAGVATMLTSDQRGFPRPVGAAPDIGAVEGASTPGTQTNAALAPAASAPGGLPDVRAAAQWLVRSQLKFTIAADGRRIEVRREQDIPARDFQITGLHFDRWASTLPQPAAGEFRVLRSITTLRSVFMQTIRGLVDEDFAFLASNADINRLEIDGSESLTDDVLPHFAGLTRLEYLKLAHAPRWTGRGIEAAAWRGSLKTAEFYFTAVDDAALKTLVACPKLERLTVSTTRVTDAGLRAMIGTGALKAFSVANCAGVTDEGVAEALPRLAGLQDLNVSGTRCGDATAAALATTLTNLTKLDMRNSRLTDAGLARLATLRHLRILDITGTRVTPAGGAAFAAQHPDCALDR